MVSPMSPNDHGSANKAQQIKEARMLASRLQLAINTGRSTTIKMKEVDKLISHRLTMQMASNLQKINEIINQTKNEIVREQLNKIYLIFLDLFNEFKNINGYKTMVRSGKIINTNLLEKLIDVDTELLGNINLLNDLIMKIPVKKMIFNFKYKEISSLIDEIIINLEKRYEILKKIN